MKITQNKSGMILIASLLIVLVLISLSAAYIMRGASNNRGAVTKTRKSQAFLIAQAGMEYAIYWFNNSTQAPAKIFATGLADPTWYDTYVFSNTNGEPYTDVDNDNVHDGNGEGYLDWGKDGRYNTLDTGENNGQYDVGEKFWDADRNGVYTGSHTTEPYYDLNRNGSFNAPDVNVTVIVPNTHPMKNYPLNFKSNTSDRSTFGALTGLVVYAPPAGTDTKATILSIAVSEDQECILKGVIDDFIDFPSVMGAVNVKGTADSSGQFNIHWGDVYALERGDGAGGIIDLGTLNVNQKVPAYSGVTNNDWWVDMYTENEITKADNEWAAPTAAFRKPYKTAPPSFHYNLERWATDVFNDADGDEEWDAGDFNDYGIDNVRCAAAGLPFHPDTGEGNGVCDRLETINTGTVSEVYDDLSNNGEAFVDSIPNGRFDWGVEAFTDAGASPNGVWDGDYQFDGGERFTDTNGNLHYDGTADTFTDNGATGLGTTTPAWVGDGTCNGEHFKDYGVDGINGTHDTGEGDWKCNTEKTLPFVADGVLGAHDDGDTGINTGPAAGRYTAAWDNNGQLDGEVYGDKNGNDKWDAGETFLDYGLDGINGTHDAGEGNGTFDKGERWDDINANGTNDYVESFDDYGADGIAGTFDAGEGNGVFGGGEAYIDVDLSGHYNTGEAFQDDGVTGLGTTNAAWVGNGVCNGDPWIDRNGDGLMTGEAMYDRNRNGRFDPKLPYPVMDYDVFKDVANALDTYYTTDSSGKVYHHGAEVDFKATLESNAEIIFFDSLNQEEPYYNSAADNNLCSLSSNGSLFTQVSVIYICGTLTITGSGAGTDCKLKNPGELRGDADNDGKFDCDNGTWTSLNAMGYTVYHANWYDKDADGIFDEDEYGEPYTDANGNALFDFGEIFWDLNADGTCNVEEYVDHPTLGTVATCQDESDYAASSGYRIGLPDAALDNIKIHMKSIVYCAGEFLGGGNAIIYGAVVADRGFGAAGTPYVWYNPDLARHMTINTIPKVRIRSWTQIQ